MKGFAFAAFLFFTGSAGAEDPDPRVVLFERRAEDVEFDRKRKARIEECASCHRKEYENWKKGPHAHAWDNASRSIRDLIGPTEKLSKRQKKKKIKRHYNSICIGCHSTSKVVYEDSLDPYWDGEGRFKSDEYESRMPLIQTNGVDCVTCHVKGNRVVTGADFKPSGDFSKMPGYCDPIASKTFSHIFNCYTCHFEPVDDYEGKFALAESERSAPYLKCETCHMQQEKGKPNHYYYWGAGQAKIDELLTPIFEEVMIGVSEIENSKFMSLNWRTDFAPHPFIPYTPKLYIFRVELFSDGGDPLFMKELRIFDESEEDGRTFDFVRSYNPEGELITLGKHENLSRRFPLPENLPKTGKLKFSILKKSEFKKKDHEADPIYLREEEYAL